MPPQELSSAMLQYRVTSPPLLVQHNHRSHISRLHNENCQAIRAKSDVFCIADSYNASSLLVRQMRPAIAWKSSSDWPLPADSDETKLPRVCSVLYITLRYPVTRCSIKLHLGTGASASPHDQSWIPACAGMTMRRVVQWCCGGQMRGSSPCVTAERVVMAGGRPGELLTRHPGESRGPALGTGNVKLDSGVRRNDEGGELHHPRSCDSRRTRD